MDQRQVDETLDRHMVTLRALGLAFSLSLVLLVLVAWLIIDAFGLEAVMELPLTITASIAVAQLAVILAGYLVSRAIRNAAPLPARAGGNTGVDTAASLDAEESMQRYTKSVIVASAAREFAATIGFVLTLLTGELLWVTALSGAALVSMLVHWPRRDAVQDFLQQQRVPR